MTVKQSKTELTTGCVGRMITTVSSTTEDYLKHIFAAAERSGQDLVSLGELAQALGVTSGTVTTMMKHLADAGFVEYRPRTGVSLTDSGRLEALDVLRRHRLTELFLVEVLRLDWSHVHEEAEILEHAMSDRVLERIDELLGYPTVDPHGDPIPSPDGKMSDPVGRFLSEINDACEIEILRVEQGGHGFLDFLKSNGLTPGAHVRLLTSNPAAGTVTVEGRNNRTTLSMEAAGKIRVRQDDALE
jgi:DtxR family Mn-dependent transcriptional regulator